MEDQDMAKPPRKERHEIGLSEYETSLIREVANGEGRAFAEVLAELVRLAIPIKLEALNKAGVFRKLQKRDRLYQKLVAMGEEDIDRLLNQLEGGEGDDQG